MQTNISDMPFDQKSPGKWVFCNGKHRHTDKRTWTIQKKNIQRVTVKLPGIGQLQTNKQNIIQIGNVSTPGIGQKQPFRGLLSTYQVEDKPIQTNLHTPFRGSLTIY